MNVEKVVDVHVRQILQDRLKEFGDDAKKAFSNLDEKPIWLNKEKGIAIKRVTITGVSNIEALHDKRDKEGNLILNKEGKTQPVDFVNTGNNHHVAIYRKPKLDKNGQPMFNENGDLQYELDEKIVSFFEATSRAIQHLPIIDKTYKQDEGWQFLFTMKQNEYFIFPRYDSEGNMIFNPKAYDEDWFKNPENYATISPNLYRVQKMSKVASGNSFVRDYVFRHHLETTVTDNKTLRDITYRQYKSLAFASGVVKVRVNHIGQIVSVGEY